MLRPFARCIAIFAVALLASGCSRSEAAVLKRQELFANACARCHGRGGTGGLPLFEGGPSPQDFSDRAFQASRTDEQLEQTIRNGKGSGMPPFRATFDDAQLAALVAQIRSFDQGRK